MNYKDLDDIGKKKKKKKGKKDKEKSNRIKDKIPFIDEIPSGGELQLYKKSNKEDTRVGELLQNFVDIYALNQQKEILTPRKLVYDIKRNFRLVRISNDIYMYYGRFSYWVPLISKKADQLIRSRISDDLKGALYSKTIKEAKEWLISDESIDSLSKFSIENQVVYLNFRNGRLNLNTYEIIAEEMPEMYFFTCIDMDVPDIKNCDKYKGDTYKQYVNQVFDTKKQKRAFEEMLGLILSPIRNKKIAFFLIGPSNTGKSVALHLIEMLMGKEFVSALSYSQLNEASPVTALIGKYVNISSDAGGITSRKTDTFKTLVEGGMMSTYLRGDDFYEFCNMALFVFACNNLPFNDNSLDEAFFSRIKPIPFYNQIPKSRQEENLDTKLFEEREYIVIRCIKALKRLKDNNFCFSNEGEMDNILSNYKAYTDSFILFSEKHIVRSRKSKVACSEIETYYKKYCELQDLPEDTKCKWARMLLSQYGAISIRMTGRDVANYNARGYQGIELVNTEELETTIIDEEVISSEYDAMIDEIQSRNKNTDDFVEA